MKKHPMSGAERKQKLRDKMSQEQKEQEKNKLQERMSQHRQTMSDEQTQQRNDREQQRLLFVLSLLINY